MRQKRKARKRYISGEFGEDGADSNQAEDDNILDGRESVEFGSSTFHQPEKMLKSSTKNQNIRADNINILSTEMLDTDIVSQVNAAFTSLETKDKVEKRQRANLSEELSDNSEMKESENVESRVNDTGAENDLSCVMDNPWYSVKARKVEGGLREFVFMCKVCGKLCHRRGNMDDHVRSHAGIKPFHCSICGNEFSRKQNLKSHFSKIHRLSLAERDKLLNEVGVPAPAVDCRQIRQQLNTSSCIMSGENNNQNEEQENLLNDLRESTSEEDILADRTISPDFSKSKVAAQTVEKAKYNDMLSDTNCGAQTFLPDTVDLKSSIAEYDEASLSKRGFKLLEDYGAFTCIAPMDGTPAKIYQCKTCKYECIRRYTMRTHTWIHTGVKQYNCELCDNAFTRNTYLKIHLSRTHSIAGSKLDDIIRRASETASSGAFTSPWQHEYIKPDNGLLAGLQSELSDSQAENKCKKEMDVNIKIAGTKSDGKDFSNEDNSVSSSGVQIENNTSRSKVHDYGKFISIETVENIIQSKVYRCKVCSYECTRRYTMKTHVWTHTGFKRFCCTFCGNSFTRSTYFRFHLRKAHSLTDVDLDAVVIKATEQNNIDFPQSVEDKALPDDNVFSKFSGGDSDESWQSEPGNISVDTPYTNSDKLKTNNVALKQAVCMEVDPFCEQLEEFKESISSSADNETGAESDCTVDCDINSYVNREKIGNKSPKNTCVKEVAATHAKDVFQATDNATGKTIDSADRPKNLQKESDAGTKSNEFITDESVKDILETLMDLETLQCLKCLRFCTSKADLKTHIKTHFSIKQYSCPVCFKRFAARANMTEHARIVHRFFGPFSDVNQANMTSRTDGHSVKMDIHVENVASISKYKTKEFSNEDLKQVTVGQKNGSTNSSLDIDESLVDAENLRCKKCQKICSNKGNLKAHVRLHMNLRPFTCPVCPKTFNKKSNMRFHVRRMHSLSTLTANFMSDISGDNFSTSFDLNEHLGSKNSGTPQQLPEGESETQTKENNKGFQKSVVGRDNHIKQEAVEDKEDTLTIDNDSVVNQKESGSESLKDDSFKQKVSNVTIKDDLKELVEPEVKSDGISGNKLDFEALTEELWGYNMQLQDNSVKRDQELNKPTKNESNLPIKNKVFSPYLFMKKESSNEKETNRPSVSNAENLNFLSSEQNIRLKCSTSESSSKSKVLNQESSVQTISAKNIGRFKILANNPHADPNIVKLRLLMDEDNLQCKECLKGFANKWSLKAHVKAIHLQGKQFICSVCNKCFNFKCNLERHYSVHFPNWVDKNKNVSDVLKEHSGLIRALPLDVPKNSESITTEILTEQYNKFAGCARDSSKELEKTVQGESATGDSFKADKRTSDLESLSTLPADIASPKKQLSDMSESPKSLSADESDTSLLEMSLMDLDYFQCKKCLKQFANKWSLKAHVRSIHIESRKHVCPVCQKTFNHKCNLDRHFVLHPSYVPQKDSNTNEWSEFQCFDCKKTFANKWSLKAHVKSIHLNARQFVCVICQKSFNHKCNLDRHIVLHASDGKGMMVNEMDLDLPIDLSSDPNKKDEEILNDSIRYSGSSVIAAEEKGNRPTGMMGVDKLKCTKCGKQCSSKSNLKSHMKLHQTFGHVCDICQKSFHNEEYLRIHYKIHFPLGDVQAKSHIDTTVDNSTRLDTSAMDNIPNTTDVILHETEVLKTEQELPSAGSEEDGPVFCGLCGDKFDSRNALHEHFETHEGF